MALLWYKQNSITYSMQETHSPPELDSTAESLFFQLFNNKILYFIVYPNPLLLDNEDVLKIQFFASAWSAKEQSGLVHL